MWIGYDPESMAAYYAEGELDNLFGYSGEEYVEVRCKYCRKNGFHWGLTEKGWRLFTDKGNLHSCVNGKTPKFRIGGKAYEP